MDILTQRQSIEQQLSSLLGGPIQLGEGRILNERTHVARFHVLDGPTGSPASVIAKGWQSWNETTSYEPDSHDPRSPAALLFNDWAGLEFLKKTMGDDSPAPRYFGGSRRLGYFVMEDIANGIDPADMLLGNDPVQAGELMVALAASLGRMHAATAGRNAEYEQIRMGLGPLPTGEEDRTRALAARWLVSLEQLKMPLSSAAKSDLELVLHTTFHPGPFLAYTHGDPCPDNWSFAQGRMRLFDFERGGFRHALRDGVYGRIHFPTCWCVNRFPPEIVAVMEQAYRAELIKGCPAAAEDGLYDPAVVEMCAFWLLLTCEASKPLLELLETDGKWGISTQRQRVLLRSQIFAELAAAKGHLRALGDAAAALAALLQARWPQEAQQMPFYPAFS